MTKEEKQTLVKYRLERANESIKAAQLLFENKLFTPAMNRIYYSMFYSVQALLVLDEKAFSKHGQVKAYFNKEFIKAGFFPKSLVNFLTLSLNTDKNLIMLICSYLKKN